MALRMQERIQTVFLKLFHVPPSASSTPETVAGWDSFGHIELIEALERAFGLHFPIEEISEMQSVADIERVLRRLGIAESP
jgi:acyl carrier protein